jgi:hypothetical protein
VPVLLLRLPELLTDGREGRTVRGDGLSGDEGVCWARRRAVLLVKGTQAWVEKRREDDGSAAWDVEVEREEDDED